MHILPVILLMLFQTFFNLYGQTNTLNSQSTNNLSTNQIQNPILQIDRFTARKNPVSFINLISLAPYSLLIEYARLNKIEVFPDDTEESLRSRIIKNQIDISAEKMDNSSLIDTMMRNEQTSGGARVELISADFVERYEIKDAGEEIIALYGNVQLKMYNYNLKADKVIYSLRTGEVYADGNLRVTDGNNDLKGLWFMLNRDDKRGILYGGGTTFQLFKIEGRLLKFSEERFFGDKSYVSLSRLSPSAHDFLVSKVYVWDNSKILIFNSIYRVGVQPVFYFPLFMQNNYGTGIISAFGQSLREGVYIQNYKNFNVFGVNHKVRFDIYQKLGVLIGDEIRYSGEYNTISLDAMFAMGRQYYLLDSYTSARLGFSTRYVNYFGEGAGQFVPRYKLAYDHTLKLYETNNIRSSIHGTMNLASDLYFKSDFYNQRPQFDLLSFFTSIIDQIQDIGDQYPESPIVNSVAINNNFYGVNLNILANSESTAVRNLSRENNTNFDYYKPKPSRLLLPSLDASYSGVIGSDGSYYVPNLGIRYNLRGSYSYLVEYKASDGIHFENNTNLNNELYAKIGERHNATVSGDVSKSFTNMFTTFTPAIRTEYRQQSTVTPTPQDIIYDRNNTYFSLGSSMSMSMFLPTSIVSDEFKNYFEPSVRWDNTYSIAYKFRDRYDTTDPYGGFGENRISSTFRVGGTGYSLFFLPDLNINVEASIGSGYDFRPNYNLTNKNYYLTYSTNRILTTEAGGTARLYYDRSYVSFDVRRNLLSTNFVSQRLNTYLYIPIPLNLLTDFIVRSAGGSDKFFDGVSNSFETYIAASYTHDFINYRYNTIMLDFGLNIQILSLWRFKFLIRSENSRAYRYIKSYAEKENEVWINPVTDILNSFDFKNNQKRMDSLFKLSSVETSLWHDLDGWEIQATFILRPSRLPSDINTASIKGSYWDKEFWITFTLTDFPGVGIPRKDINLNSTVSDLREQNQYN